MWYLFVFNLGLFSVSLLPVLPSADLLGLLFLGFIVCFYWRWFVGFSMVSGILLGSLLGYYLLNIQLPLLLDGQQFQVIGIVEGLPQSTQKKERFIFRIDSLIDKAGHKVPSLQGRKIQLSWYYRKDRSLVLKPGQRWSLTVKLKRPRGFVNPAGFDYQAYLLQKKISATGYVINQQATRLLEQDCRQIVVDCVRWWIKRRLVSQLSYPLAIGPMLALVLGDTSQLDNQQWDLLRHTGTAHLLAISGLHIGIAATVGFFIGKLCLHVGALFFPFFIRLHHFPALASIMVASFYSLLAGMSLPTQRALIMVLLFHLGSLFYRSLRPYFVLVCALTMVAVLDPLAVYNQGFWLSFLAVSLLFYGFMGRRHRNKTLFGRVFYSLVKSQWVLVIGLFLPSVLLLQGVSLSAPMVNLFAVPLVSFVIVPLLFLLLFLMSVSVVGVFESAYKALYIFVELLIQWLLNILSWFTDIDFWTPAIITSPPFGVVIIASIGILWLLAPKGIPARYLGLLCFLPLWFSNEKPLALSITFMDVGQGTAVIVRTQQHTLVYDTGRVFSQHFNAGQHIIVPYLRSEGIANIDRLVVSHNDSDHVGGVIGLLENMNTMSILSGQPLKNAVPCTEGQQWEWDGVTFEILWPNSAMAKKLLTDQMIKDNNTSCVLLVSFFGKKILLAGDIEKQVEQQLLDNQSVGPIDILLVPHHGSKTSSSLAWLSQLRPTWAIVTAGFNNPYNHPHPEVIKRYQQVGSQWLNTATAGAIRFSIADNADEHGGWRLERWRLDNRRYWYD